MELFFGNPEGASEGFLIRGGGFRQKRPNLSKLDVSLCDGHSQLIRIQHCLVRGVHCGQYRCLHRFGHDRVNIRNWGLISSWPTGCGQWQGAALVKMHHPFLANPGRKLTRQRLILGAAIEPRVLNLCYYKGLRIEKRRFNP